jgi:hypothetical protein
MLENYIPRAVNVLVMHDGDINSVSVMAQNAGFDSLNGVGSVEEVMIIGIPNATYGFACPSGSTFCLQRIYEMSPTDCDPKTNDCFSSQAYAGMSVYLDFIYDDVIPAVMSNIGFHAGEVSSVGFRYYYLFSAFSF